MKRVIKFERGTIDSLNVKKYVLVQEYEGFGIYEEVSPNGYRISQSWLVANDKVALQCGSFNDFIKEELLDMIDNYNEKGVFGTKGSHQGNFNGLDIYLAHPNHKDIV